MTLTINYAGKNNPICYESFEAASALKSVLLIAGATVWLGMPEAKDAGIDSLTASVDFGHGPGEVFDSRQSDADGTTQVCAEVLPRIEALMQREIEIMDAEDKR